MARRHALLERALIVCCVRSMAGVLTPWARAEDAARPTNIADARNEAASIARRIWQRLKQTSG